MGLTYQELKGLGKNSKVLEKQENIEIQQNSSGYCNKKKRLIRERFYIDNIEGTSNIDLKKKKKKSFEQKIQKTYTCLDNLKQAINHEIKKLQKQCNNIIMETKDQKNDYEKDMTWAENFSNNCSKKRKQGNITKETFSQKHQGVFTSPRYGSNQEVSLRPRTRTVASQIDSLNMGTDIGAVGDHNSLISVEHNKIQKPNKGGIKDVLLTPSIHKQQNLVVNCCCNHNLHPVNDCYRTVRDARDSVWHHQNFQQSNNIQSHREYQYCCDEFYYDYSSCIPPSANCCCAPPTNNKHTNTRTSKTFYGRHATDLNTHKFDCRSNSRSIQQTAESRNKPQEICREYSERKEKECKKKQNAKREKSHKKPNKQLKSQNSCHKNASKLVQHLDRYADEHKTHLDNFLKSHKNLTQKICKDTSTSTTGTTVRITSESELCRITVHCKHNGDDTKDLSKKYNNDVSMKSVYSVETLRMLQKMKIRKYVPARPPTTEKDKHVIDNNVQKIEKYQEYVEKYRKEEQENKLRKTIVAEKNINVLKDPPEVFMDTESEILLRQEQVNKEQEKTIKQTRRNTPSLGDKTYEELKHEYAQKKKEKIEAVWCKQEPDSKAFEKQNTKNNKDSKNDQQKSYSREDVKSESEEYEKKFNGTQNKKLLENNYFQADDKHNQEERWNKYKDDKAYVQESNNENNLEYGENRVQRASYANHNTKKVSPRKLELISKRKENDKAAEREAQSKDLLKDKLQQNNVEENSYSFKEEIPTEQNQQNPSYHKKLESYHATQEKDNYQELPLQVKKSDNYIATDQNKIPDMSASPSYRDFKETMDHNIGFHVARSSQTDYNIVENCSDSKKTFPREMQCEANIHMPVNTEEALQYLKSFLSSYKQLGLEKECQNSVNAAAQDLIKKLSSCKIIVNGESSLSPDKDETKLSQDKSTISLEEKLTTGTQYKDPESTPNHSQPEEEIINVSTGEDPLATRNYNCLEQEVHHYQSYLDNQHWQSEEDYQRYLEYKQQPLMTSSTPSNGFIDDQHYQFSNLTQVPDDAKYFDNAYATGYSTENNKNLPLSSYENECYERYRPETITMKADLSCSTEIVPTKGILKPYRTVENNPNVCYDFVTNRKVSTVTFGCEDHFNKARDSLLSHRQRQKQIDHQSNENLQNVRTKDENLQAAMEYLECQELSYEDQPHSEHVTNKRFLYTVDLPNFKQCPCMMDTYLKMLKIYYKAGYR